MSRKSIIVLIYHRQEIVDLIYKTNWYCDVYAAGNVACVDNRC
jgi:hypothetical protein